MKSAFQKLIFAGILSSLVAMSSLAEINPVPKMNKVLWIWLENTPYSQMVLQRYVKTLTLLYPTARFTSYLPTSPITQADVMMMIGGTDFGIQDNTLTRIFSPTLVDLLESKNIPWKIYAEDFPGACYLGEGTATFKRYRVPFLSIAHVQSDRFQCMKVVGFANLADDERVNAVPRFAVAIPNLKNSGSTGDYVAADNALKTILDPIIALPDFVQNTTIIISTTNNNNTVAGRKEMFTMVMGFGVQSGATTVTTPYNHTNLIHTIETGLDLGNLNQSDATADSMVGFWK